jgi:hypothetical protein
MPRSRVFFCLLLLAVPASAQTLPTGEVIIRPLPIPDIDENAPPRPFLAAARQDLAAGRVDTVQEALERAESRALIRSVRPSRAGIPSEQNLVKAIQAARAALAAGDRAACLARIDEALADPDVDAN